MARFLPKLAIALYLFSLASPCAIHDGYPKDHYKFGIEILLEGWLGIIAGELHWYANLVFFYVMYRARNQRHIPAKWMLSATLVVSAITVLFPVVRTSYGIVTFSPYFTIAKEVLFGTYIWTACMFLGAIVCLGAPATISGCATNNSSKPTPLCDRGTT